MLLARLALSCVLMHDFGQFSAANVPKLFPILWGDPLEWHSFFLDTASAFVTAFLHLLAGEGVWGRGRHLSLLPQQPCRTPLVVLFVLKEHHRCASRFGRT